MATGKAELAACSHATVACLSCVGRKEAHPAPHSLAAMHVRTVLRIARSIGPLLLSGLLSRARRFRRCNDSDRHCSFVPVCFDRVLLRLRPVQLTVDEFQSPTKAHALAVRLLCPVVLDSTYVDFQHHHACLMSYDV
jgi:hypothetical protein